MLFAFPPNAAFNRVIPKTKFYEHANPTPTLKAKFVSEISQVVWSYKLSPETINLAPSEGVQEIQVFTITLKGESIDSSVLTAIDRSIPSPIIFELHRTKDARTVAAYKRPNEAGGAGWVVGDYFRQYLGRSAPSTGSPSAGFEHGRSIRKSCSSRLHRSKVVQARRFKSSAIAMQRSLRSKGKRGSSKLSLGPKSNSTERLNSIPCLCGSKPT